MILRRIRPRSLLCLAMAGALSAPGLAAELSSRWLTAAYDACMAASGTDCDNPDYLQTEARRLASHDIARRAAVRGNQQERRAVRELLASHPGLCAVQLRQYCREQGSCSRNTQALCETVSTQRQQCITQATQFCRQHRLRNCDDMVARQCPAKSGDVDALLGRYPGLNATQESRIRQLATQLDSGDASQLGNAFRTLLGLLGLR